MKNFCLNLKEHARKRVNHEKKEMIPLTNEEKKLHRKKNICIKKFSANDKKYQKVRDHCHYTGKYRGAAYDTIQNTKRNSCSIS